MRTGVIRIPSEPSFMANLQPERHWEHPYPVFPRMTDEAHKGQGPRFFRSMVFSEVAEIISRV